MSAKHTPGPIPATVFDAFVAQMDAVDWDDLPDGAWFSVLEEEAGRFMKANRIKGCRNDAAHQWVRAKAKGEQQ